MSDVERRVGATVDDQRVIEGLRGGDERVFSELVDRYHSSLTRVAMRYVPSRAIAEEVVQETWIAVIEGIDRFEGRSTLKTWLYRILIYRARARGERERRTVPFSALEGDDDSTPSVPTERFRGSDALWAGHWATPPKRWDGDTEARLLAGETQTVLSEAIAALPEAQREVVTLRDIAQFTAAEVCDLLGLTEANQRVLLHRGRSRVRMALEQYLDA
ncbi:MAG TPA: sigma-70 family RNA polymerase sigma factor [Ilumatobacteraceae bacterium]